MSSLNLASNPNFLLINSSHLREGSAASPQSSLSDKMFLFLLLSPQADNRQEDLAAEHPGYSNRNDLAMTTTSTGHSGWNCTLQHDLARDNSQPKKKKPTPIKTTPFLQSFSVKLASWISAARSPMGTRKGTGRGHHLPLINSSQQQLRCFNNNKVRFHPQD